jgi:phage recombination protein Bet
MNAITQMQPAGTVANWTPRQLATIQRTLAADCTTSEFDLFIEFAKAKRLDPFSRQISAIVFSKNNPEKRRMSIIVTQDGCRVLAQRCGDYRPSEDEPVYVYKNDLKSDTNPLGIEKCTVTLWKQDKQGTWHKVNGTAFWDEFCASREIWAMDDVSQRRKPTGKFEVDGTWKKMPRLMIAKCATMQALRAGWPETFSGVYAEEEMDKAIALDKSASELVEMEREEQRARAVSMSKDEYPWIGGDGHLHFIKSGQFADEVIKAVRDCSSVGAAEMLLDRNKESMQRFWVSHKSDALDLKKNVEAELKTMGTKTIENVEMAPAK